MSCAPRHSTTTYRDCSRRLDVALATALHEPVRAAQSRALASMPLHRQKPDGMAIADFRMLRAFAILPTAL